MHSKKLLHLLKKENLLYSSKIISKDFRSILRNNLAIKKNEKVLLLGDYGLKQHRLAPIFVSAYAKALDNLNIDYSVFMQKTKTIGMPVEKDVELALKNLDNKSVIVLVLSNKLGSLKNTSLGKSFRRYVKSKDCRFVSTTSLGCLKTSDLFKVVKPMNLDLNKLKRKQLEFKKKLDAAREVRILTDKGTDVKFNVQRRYSISIDGDYKNYKAGGNLPPGEVYIAPIENKTEGKIVLDGSIRLSWGTVLPKKPVMLNISKGRVNSIKGGREAMALKLTLSMAMRKSRVPANIKVVGELGIGFNERASILGAMMIDEKAYATSHIAFGSNYWFGGKNYALGHYDQVFKNPVFYFDGEEVKY